MQNLLKRSIVHIDDHWIEKEFYIQDVHYQDDELLINFHFDTDKENFILHGSDAYRLAQYALLIYSLIFIHEHDIAKSLKLWEKPPEEMIKHIQIVSSNIEYRKPITQHKNIMVKTKHYDVKDKLTSSNLLFVNLMISVNDDAHVVDSCFVINMR